MLGIRRVGAVVSHKGQTPLVPLNRAGRRLCGVEEAGRLIAGGFTRMIGIRRFQVACDPDSAIGGSFLQKCDLSVGGPNPEHRDHIGDPFHYPVLLGDSFRIEQLFNAGRPVDSLGKDDLASPGQLFDS